MTEDPDPPPGIRRFRWARSHRPYGREIEAIAAMWVDGGLTREEVRRELNALKQVANLEIYERTDISRKFLELSQQYMAVFNDIFCVEKALEKSEKREDVTPIERLRTLLDAIRRLQQGGLQK